MKRSKLKIKPKFSKSSDWEIVEDIPMAQDGGYQWSTQKQEPVKLAIPKDVNVSKTESNRKLTPKELEELRKYTEEQNQLRKEEEYNKRLQAIQQANQAKNQPLTIDNLRTQTQATGDKMSFAMNTRFGNPKEYPTLSGYMDALDFINPGKFIGDMATGLGALPYNVREGNYGQAALAIGTPLTTGALAGIGVNSTKQFVNNLANPVAGIDFKQLKHLNVYKHLPEDATATTLGFGNKNPYLHNKKQILLSDAEASINEKLAKGYGINKKGSDLSVQLKRTPPISDAETDFEFLIKENNRKIGTVGLNKRLGTESNFKKGTYYEKDFDFPYMWVDKKEYLGSGISGEVNKAITDYLQENNLGYLYSSLNHTPEGLKRWEKLVKEGKAERVDKNRYKLKQSGGKIKTDPKGYWNPENINEPMLNIPSNYISMENIPFPILGISDTGDTKIMQPNQKYKFKGKNVKDIPMAQDGKLIKNPTQENSYYTPSSSDRNIQQNIIKQQEINKIKNQIDFPLYKSNENTKELKTQIGDQSEILKNVVFKDQLPEYVRLIKNHPEQENLWKKETLERAKNYENDISKYLAALQLLKENGSPYLTQNSYFEDKYRKNKNSPTSNFRASKNLMYLEPNDRDAFIAELSHAQQLKDNFLEDKNVSQKLDSIYKKQKQTNPNIDYHEVYDKYYYNMPNSIEYDAHTLRQPKLEERYYFLTDSFKNELPFMSFTPQYKVNEKIKLDNAGKDYYKGNIGNLRRIINKGVDNIFGTDIYKAFGNDPKKYKSGGSIKTDPQGYWNPKNKNEKALKIPSNNISMQNIDFPILGISDTNDIKMMYPNGEYQFQGNSVTEFPIMQHGGQVRQPIRGTREQYQAYQDSLDLYTANRDRLVQLERESRYATNMFGQSGLYDNGVLSEHYTYLPPHRVTHNQYSLTNVPSNYENGNDRTYWGFENRRSNVTINPITYHGFDRRFRQNVIRGTNQTVNLPGQNDLHEYAGIWQFPQPVQPIIYTPENERQNPLEQPQVPFPNTTNGQFNRTISKIRPKQTTIQIESKKADLLPTSPMNLEIERIPFAQGTYFTRDRQNQELDSKQFGRKVKKDYFDKKTGKLLGTYKNGEKVSDWEIID